MTKNEVMALIDAYLDEKKQQRCTAHIMLDIHMNQGGFGVPQFNVLQPESTKILPNGLKFVMED